MKLYKYLSLDRLDVLSSRMLRFTQPALFNDPFEGLPSVKYEEINHTVTFDSLLKAARIQNKQDALKRISALTSHLNIEFDEENFEKYLPFIFQEHLSNEVGILSLSSTNKSLLMWSHYASDHQGFVIELDISNDIFGFLNSNITELFSRPHEITYSKKRNVISSSNDPWTIEEFKNTHLSELIIRFLTKTLLTKSSEWSYEKEWRYIYPLINESSRINNEDGDISVSYTHLTLPTILRV